MTCFLAFSIPSDLERKNLEFNLHLSIINLLNNVGGLIGPSFFEKSTEHCKRALEEHFTGIYYLPRSEEKIFLGIVLVQILVPPLIPESLFFMVYASIPRSCPSPDPGHFLVLRDSGLDQSIIYCCRL